MKSFNFLIIILIAINSSSLKAEESCAKNPRQQLAANTLAKTLVRTIGQLPNGLDGFDTIQVTEVGTGKICDFQWAKQILNLPMQEVAQVPTCGIVYYFSDKESLKNFAKSSIALRTQSSIIQFITKPNHSGNSVGGNDLEKFNVPVCAALKN